MLLRFVVTFFTFLLTFNIFEHIIINKKKVYSKLYCIL